MIGYSTDYFGYVPAAARWAGYNWSQWRQTTSTLNGVSSEVTDPDTNLRPGDILNKAGFHVVTVYQYTPGHINVRDSTIIEAAGAYYLYNRTEFYEPDKVWKRYPSNLKKEYLDRGYSPRRLVSY